MLVLVIGDAALSASSAAAATAAAISAALIGPVFAPRWSVSLVEAATVPLAMAGVIIFWLIVPIAGAAKVAGLDAAVADACAVVQALRTDVAGTVTLSP